MKVVQSCQTLCDPMDYIVHGILQARILEWQPFPSAGDLPNPGIEPRSPVLQVDSLPVEPQGKPRNTRVGSLSLFQGIFLTQESNWGLLHYRHILYQLSQLLQGSNSWLDFTLFSAKSITKQYTVTIWIYLKSKVPCVLSHSVTSDSLQPPGLQPAKGLLCPWNFPGNHNGMGCHFLPQKLSRLQSMGSQRVGHK